MRADTLIAAALDSGWQDDTAFAPSFATALFSKETPEGYLLGVTVDPSAPKSYLWSVQAATDAVTMRPVRGAAETLGSAILAATAAMSTVAASGRLF